MKKKICFLLILFILLCAVGYYYGYKYGVYLGEDLTQQIENNRAERFY